MIRSFIRVKEPVVYLTIIFTLFIGVFVFVPAVAVQKQEGGRASQSPQTGEKDPGAVSSDEGEQDIQAIMKALEERERELSIREEALKKEEERLNMLKNSVELSLKQYSSLRDRMQQRDPADNEPKDGMARMAKLYESMSVEEAAQRIEKMDTDLAVKLLTAIKSKKAGKILGAITAEKAASLSAGIASRTGGK